MTDVKPTITRFGADEIRNIIHQTMDRYRIMSYFKELGPLGLLVKVLRKYRRHDRFIVRMAASIFFDSASIRQSAVVDDSVYLVFSYYGDVEIQTVRLRKRIGRAILFLHEQYYNTDKYQKWLADNKLN